MTDQAIRRVVLPAALAMVGAVVVVHVVGGLTKVNILRLDREQSVGAWFSSMQFAAAAGACALAASRTWVPTAPWILLGALLLGFSVDESVSAHEAVGGSVGVPLAERLLQPVAGILVLTIFAWCARGASGRVRVLVLLGAGALIAGQGFATLGSLLTPTGVGRIGLSLGEEVGEMLVGTFVLVAGLDFARVDYPRLST